MRISDDEFQAAWEKTAKTIVDRLYVPSKERGKFLYAISLMYQELTETIERAAAAKQAKRPRGPRGSPS